LRAQPGPGQRYRMDELRLPCDVEHSMMVIADSIACVLTFSS
jgi:hypothetical protein